MNRRCGISVCMAAYNGEEYIAAQLRSILSQLGDDDEIVVVDDASTDATRSRVRAFGDCRVRLIEHAQNRGIVPTFEHALRSAAREFIFLSDQDDLWVPDKVETIMREFAADPGVTLIASDAAPIDVNGVRIADSYFQASSKFSPGLWTNILRNRYMGCTMAFRATLLPAVLPLPHRFRVLHDVWIGARNALSHGQTLYIDRPLVLYRRHSTTATGRKRLSLAEKVWVRLSLLLALADFSIRKKLKIHPDLNLAERKK